jgi:hypothetical protein
LYVVWEVFPVFGAHDGILSHRERKIPGTDL